MQPAAAPLTTSCKRRAASSTLGDPPKGGAGFVAPPVFGFSRDDRTWARARSMRRAYAKASSAAFGHQPRRQSALGQFQNVLRKNIPLDLIRSSVNRRRPRLNEQPGWVQLTVAVQFPELASMLAGNFQHCLSDALVKLGLVDLQHRDIGTERLAAVHP